MLRDEITGLDGSYSADYFDGLTQSCGSMTFVVDLDLYPAIFIKTPTKN
jgi:hypothetical protein